MTMREATTDRLMVFSDGVFAVVITILVLELKPPASPSFQALISVWPTAVSYAVSYLFIAIVWINHHHLLRYADLATARLIWVNFAHLFSVSLIPFSTTWIADTDFGGGVPVSLHAGVFALVNATYLLLCLEIVDRHHGDEVPQRERTTMRIRSLVTLAMFVISGIVAPWHLIIGIALICLCLVVYLRPEAPGLRTTHRSVSVKDDRTR